jgi:hypothetical protein
MKSGVLQQQESSSNDADLVRLQSESGVCLRRGRVQHFFLSALPIGLKPSGERCACLSDEDGKLKIGAMCRLEIGSAEHLFNGLVSSNAAQRTFRRDVGGGNRESDHVFNAGIDSLTVEDTLIGKVGTTAVRSDGRSLDWVVLPSIGTDGSPVLLEHLDIV